MRKAVGVALLVLVLLVPVEAVRAAAGGDPDESAATAAGNVKASEEQSTTRSFPVAWPIAVVLLLPLVSTGLFYFWLRRQKQLDHDQKLKSWDVFFKMIGTVTLIAGGMIAVGEYLEDRDRYLAESKRQHEREIQQRDHELNMRLFDRTSQVYSEFLDTTAKLAFAETHDKELVRRFNQLYHGQLMMVESVDVARLASEFQMRLQAWPDGEPSPEDLQMLSLQIAAACRNHLHLFEVAKGMPARVGRTEDVLAETQQAFATAP